MQQPWQEPLDELVAAHRQGRPLVLLFDYDGTLTRLMARPHLARLSERLRRLLVQLAGTAGVHLGVVSGRGIDDLKRMVALPQLYYGGTTGLELDLRGRQFVPPQAEQGQQLVTVAARDLAAVAQGFPGAWVEVKRFGLTLHYRQVAPQRVNALCAQARLVFRPCADQWLLRNGALALEVTLAVGWTKASAVRLIAADVGQTAFPFYAGDDTNDADALETVTAQGGVSVGVGARAPWTARYRFAGPETIEKLLDQLLPALGGGKHVPHLPSISQTPALRFDLPCSSRSGEQ